MKVDPAGLAVAAQRIADALAELIGGDPAHPPLGADPASTGAAARLSAAAVSLVATIVEQALGLAATAAQLVNVGTTFGVQDVYNKSGLEKLGTAGLVPVTGWAPAPPPLPPDIRPPLAPPPPVPGEALATAVHSGDPGAGAAFISGWTQLVSTLGAAADTVRSVGDGLPDQWDSPISTDAVRAHLYRYAEALDDSAARAQMLAQQADVHGEQNVQARRDIPAPAQFAALRQQIQTVSAANTASGGKYAAQLGQLLAEKNALDGKASDGYSAFHGETEATTAGDGAAGDPGAGWVPDPHQPVAGRPGEQLTPDQAGQLASMLPQMMSTVFGAAGGLVGGALSSFGKVPEALMQAGAQVAGQVSQGLGGLMTQGSNADAADKARASDPLAGAHGGLGASGGGGTLPEARIAPPPAVTPTTGPPPNLPSMPGGGLPQPVSSAAGPSGLIPMGMPLGGPAGAGQGGAGGPQPPRRSKKVVLPPYPNTESVTGRVNSDRIAMSAPSRPGTETEPPHDDPPQSPRPVVRRIAISSRDDEP